MGIYSKPQITLLTDLINEANPNYHVSPLGLENTSLGVPRAYSPTNGGIANTEIDATALPGSFFIGRIQVHYRRIDTTRLFAGQVIHFDRWSNGTITPVEIARWLNERYNTTFVPADFVSFSFPSGDVTRTITLAPGALCYQGQIQFIWNEGKRALDQIVEGDIVGGLRWTDVNDGDSKPLLSLTGFGLDYTDMSDTLHTIANGAGVNVPAVTNLLRAFNERTGMTLDPNVSHESEGGVNGLFIMRHALPSTNLTQANALRYTHALSIASEPTSWFNGRLLFHYNLFRLHFPDTITLGSPFVLEITRPRNDTTYYWTFEGEASAWLSTTTTSGQLPARSNAPIDIDTVLTEDVSGRYPLTLAIRQGSAQGVVVQQRTINVEVV